MTKTYTLAPRSRRTLFVDEEDPILSANNVSASITSDQPIVVERALYLASLGQAARRGHRRRRRHGPGDPMVHGRRGHWPVLRSVCPARQSNTDGRRCDADVSIAGRHALRQVVPVAAQSRQTILIDEEDLRLANTPVSVVAESTNNVPIIAERAQWWPQSHWYEGHASVGATASSRKWALAGGEAILAATSSARTFIMIANVSNVAGTATVTFAPERATTRMLQLNLPANSRTTVPLDWDYSSGLFQLAGPIRFGAVVASPDVDLVVEQAVYRDVNGVIWAAGMVAVGEPIP